MQTAPGAVRLASTDRNTERAVLKEPVDEGSLLDTRKLELFVVDVSRLDRRNWTCGERLQYRYAARRFLETTKKAT